MIKGIYAGSFDPFTNGHLDLVTTASKLFEEVIILIAVNPEKKYMVGETKRLRTITESIRHLDNVKVDYHSGLVVDYAKKKNVQFLIRGLRNGEDLIDEAKLADYNRRLSKNTIRTIFIPASVENTYISSRDVKEIWKVGGDCSAFVPGPIAKQLKQLYNATGQKKRQKEKIVVAVSGGIASGKSTIQNILEVKGYHCIDADDIVDYLYNNDDELINMLNNLLVNYGCRGKSYYVSNKKDKGDDLKKILNEHIWNNESLKNSVEQVVHPKVFKEIWNNRIITDEREISFVFIPLLYKYPDQEDRFDFVVDVITDKESQKERLKVRNPGICDEAIDTLWRATNYKSYGVDFEIENTGDIEDLNDRVEEFLEELDEELYAK